MQHPWLLEGSTSCIPKSTGVRAASWGLPWQKATLPQRFRLGWLPRAGCRSPSQSHRRTSPHEQALPIQL